MKVWSVRVVGEIVVALLHPSKLQSFTDASPSFDWQAAVSQSAHKDKTPSAHTLFNRHVNLTHSDSGQLLPFLYEIPFKGNDPGIQL